MPPPRRARPVPARRSTSAARPASPPSAAATALGVGAAHSTLTCGPASMVKKAATPASRSARTAPIARGRGVPVEDRRVGGHGAGVHAHRAPLGDGAQRRQIARRDGGARRGQIAVDAPDPGIVVGRRGGRARHGRRRAERLFARRGDGHDQADVPAGAAPSSGLRHRVAAVGRAPRAISTKPPKIERAAEPEPRRASSDSSAGDSASPAARVAARASAANPDADDARPGAVGTLLSVIDRRARRDPRPRAHAIEKRRHARRELLAGRRAVQRDPIGAARRRRRRRRACACPGNRASATGCRWPAG